MEGSVLFTFYQKRSQDWPRKNSPVSRVPWSARAWSVLPRITWFAQLVATAHLVKTINGLNLVCGATHPRPSAIVALASRATRATSGISSSTCHKIIVDAFQNVFMIATSWTTGTAATTWSYSTWPASLVTLTSILLSSHQINVVDRNLITLLRWSGAVLTSSSSVLLLTDSRGSTLLHTS